MSTKNFILANKNNMVNINAAYKKLNYIIYIKYNKKSYYIINYLKLRKNIDIFINK